jgi:O-acetylhomoserine (thiol)-lyase
MDKNTWGFYTNSIRAGYDPDETGSIGVPLYPTTAYKFKNMEHSKKLFALQEFGNIYTRITNPTNAVFEQRISALEGANPMGGLAACSGHAAIAMLAMNICTVGDEIVSSRSMYGGTLNLMKNTFINMGIKVIFVDSDNPKEFEAAVTDKTKLFFFESVGNPLGDIPDIDAIVAIAKKHNIPTCCDNTVATPALYKPFDHGCNMVLHSTTKYICGNGSVMGGVLIDNGSFEWKGNPRFPGLNKPDPSYKGLVFTDAFGNFGQILKARAHILRDVGMCQSPFNSYLNVLGLETLGVRMDRHVQVGKEVAEWIEKQSHVAKCTYSGLASSKYKDLVKKNFPKGVSPVFTFDLKGGRDAAKAFGDSLEMICIVANLGDSRTIINCPTLTTHSQVSDDDLAKVGLSPGTVRISIGMEDPKDIIADLQQALAKIK